MTKEQFESAEFKQEAHIAWTSTNGGTMYDCAADDFRDGAMWFAAGMAVCEFLRDLSGLVVRAGHVNDYSTSQPNCS